MSKMEVSILPVNVTVTIDTMLNFDGDFDRHGDVTCKQTFTTINSLQAN